MIPFGEFLPDRAPFLNEGALVAENVFPAEGNYRPLPSLSAVAGSSLNARCQGARGFSDKELAARVFAGDQTRLYERQGDTMADLSGSSYSIPSHATWRFEQFGDNIVAVAQSQDPQIFNTSSGLQFDDLGGGPPQAEFATRVRDFLVLGKLNDGADGIQPFRIRWSGFNNIEIWGTDIAAQSDFQDLNANGGAITGIVGREYGTIFQRNSITRMTFEGADNVFRFDVVEENRGAIEGNSIVNLGRLTFFLSEDGFYVWDQQQSTPIGKGKIDRFFADRVRQDSLFRMSAAIDPVNKLICWAYPTVLGDDASDLLIYHWPQNRWSNAVVSTEYIYNLGERSFTLEELDAESTGGLEGLPFSLDSPVWRGGKVRLGAFNTANQIATFEGNTLAAIIETGDFGAANNVTMVTAIRPLVDNQNNNTTVQIGSRFQTLGDTISFSAASSQTAEGVNPVRSLGRYHRARINLPANSSWTHAIGIEETFQVMGRR